MDSYSSRLLEDAVNEFAALPGIGRKSALRMVLHLLRQEGDDVERFGKALLNLRNNIRYCDSCHNISDQETCTICANPSRDRTTVCVVENIRDVIAIEHTHQYRGVYHILGGIISPIDGIGPADLHIESLVSKVSQGEIKEVIMALSTTMEGDTTNFYIYKRLKDLPVNISTIARGVAMGDELEYADEITLGRSIKDRIPYEKVLTK